MWDAARLECTGAKGVLLRGRSVGKTKNGILWITYDTLHAVQEETSVLFMLGWDGGIEGII